ncbi:phosphatase PAP2 family protein [Marinomonas epiphytica]
MNILQNIHAFDVSAFYWCMARKRRDVLTRIGKGVSFTADGPLYALIGVLLWWYGYDTLALIIAVGFILERCLYLILKKGFKRNRPADILEDFTSFIIPSDQFSFPSGHTSGAFFMAYCLAEWFPGLNEFLYLWATHVGLSRVFLGVHFPTDTVVGACLGTSCAMLMVGVLA